MAHAAGMQSTFRVRSMIIRITIIRWMPARPVVAEITRLVTPASVVFGPVAILTPDGTFVSDTGAMGRTLNPACGMTTRTIVASETGDLAGSSGIVSPVAGGTLLGTI